MGTSGSQSQMMRRETPVGPMWADRPPAPRPLSQGTNGYGSEVKATDSRRALTELSTLLEL